MPESHDTPSPDSFTYRQVATAARKNQALDDCIVIEVWDNDQQDYVCATVEMLVIHQSPDGTRMLSLRAGR